MAIQSEIEEKGNWITHGIGVLIFIIGFFILLDSNSNITKYSTAAIIIYCLALIMLYTASTVYHYVTVEHLKQKLRILDHISIYFLIAGTYTPVTLIPLIDSKGWLLFTLVWSITALGTVLKLFFTGRFEVISLILYVVMGWLIVLDMEVLSQKVGEDGINYLIYGGIAYTGGIVFYTMRKLKFQHVIWHCFVLAGSIFHFIFIWKYII